MSELSAYAWESSALKWQSLCRALRLDVEHIRKIFSQLLVWSIDHVDCFSRTFSTSVPMMSQRRAEFVYLVFIIFMRGRPSRCFLWWKYALTSLLGIRQQRLLFCLILPAMTARPAVKIIVLKVYETQVPFSSKLQTTNEATQNSGTTILYFIQFRRDNNFFRDEEEPSSKVTHIHEWNVSFDMDYKKKKWKIFFSFVLFTSYEHSERNGFTGYEMKISCRCQCLVCSFILYALNYNWTLETVFLIKARKDYRRKH